MLSLLHNETSSKYVCLRIVSVFLRALPTPRCAGTRVPGSIFEKGFGLYTSGDDFAVAGAVSGAMSAIV